MPPYFQLLAAYSRVWVFASFAYAVRNQTDINVFDAMKKVSCRMCEVHANDNASTEEREKVNESERKKNQLGSEKSFRK